MRISVVYSDPHRQIWRTLDVPDTATVEDAIDQSGILGQCPQIDLGTQKTGVFGKFVQLDAPLKPGDRVEIYRPIIADPETVPRKDRAGEEAGASTQTSA